MKIRNFLLVTFSLLLIIGMLGCASKTKVRVIEIENKGSITGVSTPNWVKDYISNGISKVQSQREFRDKYCIIGEQSGANRQFVVDFADHFSAQQRIGAMLRTSIASEYQARVQGLSQLAGLGAPASANTSSYQQEIDSVINAIINVSYSGAQRESDWWSLRRRYDPDKEGVFTDEFTAYVLYTIPKGELNLQVARALETSISRDSALYDVTIEMARNILQNGIATWGE